MGFSCGVPLFLTAGTLAIWFAERGISYHTIGLFALARLPYTLRFLWAPFMDRVPIPLLTAIFGRRRSWMLLSQIVLIVGLCGFSRLDPARDLMDFAWLSLLITFAAATQETAMMAYQMESLKRPQYGPGESASVLGYRLGMLASGAGALSLASFFSWPTVYILMSGGILIGIITVLCISEPTPFENLETRTLQEKAAQYLKTHPTLKGRYADMIAWLYATITCPFRDFMRKQGWLACLSLMLLFKLADSLTSPMTNIFLLDIGFSKLEIAAIAKLWGGIALAAGGVVGGLLVKRLGFFKSLFVSLLAHTLTHVLYIVLLYTGPRYSVLCLVTIVDHFTAGARTTALFAYQFTMTSATYAATQLALLGSFVNLGRTLASSLSGWLVELLHWKYFFILTAFAIIPSLLLIVRLMVVAKREETANNP